MSIPYKQQQGNENIQTYNNNHQKGDPPNYKGNGVDVWINTDKNGKKYLSVKILNGATVNCFKYEPKQYEPVDDGELNNL